MKRIERFSEKRKKIQSLNDLSLLRVEKNSILTKENKKLTKLNANFFAEHQVNNLPLAYKNIKDIPKFHQKTLGLTQKISANLKSEILDFDVKRKFNNEITFSERMQKINDDLKNLKNNFEDNIKEAQLDFSDILAKAKTQEKRIKETSKSLHALENNPEFNEVTFRNESFGFKTQQMTKTSTLTRDYKSTHKDKDNINKIITLLIILGSCLAILILFVLLFGGF